MGGGEAEAQDLQVRVEHLITQELTSMTYRPVGKYCTTSPQLGFCASLDVSHILMPRTSHTSRLHSSLSPYVVWTLCRCMDALCTEYRSRLPFHSVVFHSILLSTIALLWHVMSSLPFSVARLVIIGSCFPGYNYL